MATYFDLNPGQGVETGSSVDIRPAAIMPAPEAAQRVYERGSIAEMLQRMFNEAEQNPAAYTEVNQEYGQEIFPSDTEAFQMFLAEIEQTVKNSDAVKHLQQLVKTGQEVTVHDTEAVFRAYDQAFRSSLSKLKSQLSSKQINVLKFQGRSELDWSFRDIVTQHLVAASESELKFDPLDFFLLINSKARKIDYMDSGEILATLRHSMSTAATTTERLKNDLRAVESISSRPDAPSILNSQEVHQLQSKIA